MAAGPLRDLLTLLLGLATGVLSALFGVGGAIVSNPGLRALGAAPLVAVGSITNRPAMSLFLSLVVPGDGHLLLLLLAVLLAFPAWRTAVTGPGSATAGHDREPGRRGAAAGARKGWLAAGIGLLSGLLSGLLGIGGGVIMVPAFVELLGLPLKSAIATSLVCVGIFGIPATVTHGFLGDIDWRLATLLTVGVIPGARIGASLTIRTAERRLRLAVGVFLALVALVYFVTETRALLGEL